MTTIDHKPKHAELDAMYADAEGGIDWDSPTVIDRALADIRLHNAQSAPSLPERIAASADPAHEACELDDVIVRRNAEDAVGARMEGEMFDGLR